MSFSMPMNPDYYYLCDGVYWNWDLENHTENRTNYDELKRAEEVTFSKSFRSSEAYRLHHFFEILTSNMRYMANRYCQYEILPKDYAEVAIQKTVLKDIVYKHATALGISLSLNQINNLDGIVLNIYQNKGRDSVYNRVGVIQALLHSWTLEEGLKIEELDRELMRRLLSLCRLHIAISDIRKKKINLILDELIRNNLDAKESSANAYVAMLNRNYIPSWRKRHLKSLLHFCPREDRRVLKGLLNLKQPFNNVAVQEVIFG
ncbi:hypothetical protein N5C36_19280 [Shewanella xiamenensis]|uniref:hypothetical protein n=1 Tax=Shewanella xiamenensis TaxID=332186 RepID=UPI00244937C3|nr:hypothetical protein [Shewanella xiamenensis]MDH1316216.1 hypothetical protein [Shewanella xiamenensis]